MTRDRGQEADHLHQQGLTYDEIGVELGISTSYACRAAERWRNQQRLGRQWHAGLPINIAHILNDAGFQNRREVELAHRMGDLEPGKLPGIGDMAYEAIEEWLGIPSEERHSHRPPGRIDVILTEEAGHALALLRKHTTESPSAIVNRLIIEAAQRH